MAKEIGELGAAYWLVVGAGAIFTLARFSEAFLVIRAQDGGLALAWTPAVIAVMSLVFAAQRLSGGTACRTGSARGRCCCSASAC